MNSSKTRKTLRKITKRHPSSTLTQKRAVERAIAFLRKLKGDFASYRFDREEANAH